MQPRPVLTGFGAFVRSSFAALVKACFRFVFGVCGRLWRALFRLVFGQPLARFYGGRVTRDVGDDLILLGMADQCFVELSRQRGGGELGKGRARTWLRRALARRGPSRIIGAVEDRYEGVG